MPTQQEHYYDSLLTRVRTDKYPSSQLMNRLEDMFVNSEQIVEYVDVLLEKLDASRYPSSQVLDRIDRMLLMVARAT